MMQTHNDQRVPTMKEYAVVLLVLLLFTSSAYAFYKIATMWDDHRAEIVKKFKSGEEIICHEGTRAHRVTKSSGWEISGEYLEKGEFLLHMNGCKLENNTGEKR